MELLVGWRELPVPRHPWDVRSAWASIMRCADNSSPDEVEEMDF